MARAGLVLGWCWAGEDQIACLERVPIRSQPLSSLAGGQLGKARLMEDARASTMEGFSHLTPPSVLLSPNLGRHPGPGQRMAGVGKERRLFGRLCQAEEGGMGAGLCRRLLFHLEGCAQAALLPASLLVDMPSLQQLNKVSLINYAMKRLLQGTCSLVYSLGLCHLICEMVTYVYVSISEVPVSTDTELFRWEGSR